MSRTSGANARIEAIAERAWRWRRESFALPLAQADFTGNLTNTKVVGNVVLIGTSVMNGLEADSLQVGGSLFPNGGREFSAISLVVAKLGPGHAEEPVSGAG